MVGELFACFLMFFFFNFMSAGIPIFFALLTVFPGFIVLPSFQRVFNHSDFPFSSTSKYNLLYNFQDYFLMIDTNSSLFTQTVTTSNFCFVFCFI